METKVVLIFVFGSAVIPMGLPSSRDNGCWLPGIPETACSAPDPCPQRSASSEPPQIAWESYPENHFQQRIFTQPGSKGDLASNPLYVCYEGKTGPVVASRDSTRFTWAARQTPPRGAVTVIAISQRDLS
jgi:hypothetical protein